MAFDGITIAAMYRNYIKILTMVVLIKLHSQSRMH